MSQIQGGRNARHTTTTGRAQHTLDVQIRSSRAPFLSVDTRICSPFDDNTTLTTLPGPFDQHFTSPLSSYSSFNSVLSAATRPESDNSQCRHSNYGTRVPQGAIGYDNYGQMVASTLSVPYLSVSSASNDPSPMSPENYTGGSQAMGGHNNIFEGGYFDGSHLILRCKWEGCDYTGGFRRTHDLKRHVLTQHIEPRSHECPEYGCGMSFNRRDNLRWHLRRVHPRNPANS
ncbi:hypothetical protein BJY01DRAFT_252242 [Aspergillus pseudoustus]|uniref:C2H2-type domain-containing protein n=1 Tax=Aspergillus pseudoustus TaxID=1810923 RepID=A0ABR4J7B1_9EURO